MAKDARMLHLNISKSLQVDSLPLPARLLFTWMIAHADDDGRLKGDPKYVKGCVVPLTNWSTKNIQKYLELMKNIGLIYYWQENEQWFVEFVKWNMYQHIRSDRYKSSDLPSFHKNTDNQTSTNQQPSDNQTEPEANINEVNPKEFNISESKEEEPIAVKNSYKGNSFLERNPDTFEPQTPGEAMAKEIWGKLEPDNKWSFYSTYLKPIRKGLPSDLLYQFYSEIIHGSKKPENPGAVMNKKIKDYFDSKDTS